MLSARNLVTLFQASFWENLSELIQDSRVSMYDLMLDANAVVIRSPEEQELFYEQVGDINEFFALHLPDQVFFHSDSLRDWARDALNFARENSTHPNFEVLFSSGVDYKDILKSYLYYDLSTEDLASWFSARAMLTTVHVSNVYPETVEDLLAHLAEASIEPSLRQVAAALADSQRGKRSNRRKPILPVEASRVKAASSYKDYRGVVRFSARNGKLAIEAGAIQTPEKASIYKTILERALRRLESNRVVERLHNRDPVIVELLQEYREVLEQDGPAAQALIWTVGHDIDNRLKAGAARSEDDGGLDQNDLMLIDTFLTSHHIYVQCFEIVQIIGDDLQRSTQLYDRLDEGARKSPWNVLRALGSENGLVEDRDSGIMLAATSSLEGSAPTRGMLGMGFGLLRGSLLAIGRFLVDAVSKAVGDSFAEVGKDSIIESLKSERIYSPMLHFLSVNLAGLFRLSTDLPHYFSWVGRLLNLLGLG